MSDFTSTVIVDVSISNDDAKAKASQLTSQLNALKEAQELLAASGKKLSTGYVELSQKIQQTAAERKAYLQLAASEEGSINQLRSQLTLLTKQYNALSASERDNTKAGQALQANIKSTSDQLKKLEGAVGDNRRSVGNYREEILRAGQDLLPFGSSLGRTISSVKSLAGAFGEVSSGIGGFSAALAATGIGAIILGVASLAAYLKDLDAVTDTSAQAISGFKASLNELGRSILSLDFKDLVKRMTQVGIQAAIIKDQQQRLEDSMLAQSVKSAEAQAEVAKKRTEAMNHALDPKERIKLLADAEKIDADDLAKREELNKRQIQIAQTSIALTGNLTKFQLDELKKRGVDYALYLQNNLVKQGKVTDEQTKRLAEALDKRTQIENEYTQRSERRNNLAERIALQAEAKEKERQAHLDEIAKDRIHSELLLAESVMTIRQKELADVDADIKKRKILYDRWGQDSSNLEKERLARIKALHVQFAKEDVPIIQGNLNRATRSRISTITDPNQRADATRDQDSLEQLQALDQKIADIRERIQKGEKGITEILQSALNERKALVDKFNYEDVHTVEDRNQKLTDLNKAAALEQRAYLGEQLKWEQDQNAARLQMNAELAGSYMSLASSIQEIFGKKTELGKAALIAEKGFAVAEIVINSEREKAAISAAYGLLKLQAVAASSLAGPFAPFVSAAAIFGLNAAEAVEIGAITAKEFTSVAAIVASTVSSFAQGGKVSGPGTSTSDSIPARLSHGESVMTAKATQMFAPWLSEMNVAGGGVPFATGGLAGSYVPSLSNQATHDNAITRSIMSGISGMRPVVYVEDINVGQHRMDVTVQAGNF